MLYKPQQTDTSVAAGFLDRRQNNRAVELYNRVVCAVASFVRRMAEHHRRAVLRRETMKAMAKLNDRMMSDIGWPGRYEPEGDRRPLDR